MQPLGPTAGGRRGAILEGMASVQIRALRVLSCDSRVRILRLLQERQDLTTVDDVATAVGLHVNTAREHLDRLVATGFVERQVEHRTVRGRPRMLYRSIGGAAAAVVDARAHNHMISLLLEGYGRALESPADAAEEAGRAWAARLGCPGAAGSADPAGDAAAQIEALRRHLEDLGFEPEVQPASLSLRLHHCPFEGVPSENRGVVCAAHLGLAQGVLARHEGPLAASALGPDGEGCVLELVVQAHDAVPAGQAAPA